MIVLAVAVLAAVYVVTACVAAARPAETTAAAFVLAGAVLVAMGARLPGGGPVSVLLLVSGVAAGALAPLVAVGGLGLRRGAVGR